jgi:DNA-binding transcriptional regulator YiaG
MAVAKTEKRANRPPRDDYPAYVEVLPIKPPALTGNVIHDARILTGFTVREFAGLFEVSTRTYYQWQERGTAPRFPQTQIEALQLIGLTLCRSLGPDGIHSWLVVGAPSVLENILRGRIDLAQHELERELSANFV